MRWWVIAALVATSAQASADPLAWSTFFGAEKLPTDIRLGGAVEPEQRPLTGPLVGGRISYVPTLSSYVAAGIEGELAINVTWTGWGYDSFRHSYFAPVINYRAAAIVKLFPECWLQPHLLGGAGAASTVSASPYMSSDTDAVYFWGAGLTVVVDDWQLRTDGRQVWMPVMNGDRAAVYEIQVGVGRSFGAHAAPPPVVVEETPPPPPVKPLKIEPPHADLVIPVPPSDIDGDGIPDDKDQCKAQAEDKDGFEDEDGCPDLDNDKDGIADTIDKCPNQPETKNGFDDEDGCPDDVPAPILAAFEAASAVRFEPAKARITAAGKLSLAKTLKALREHPQLKVTITGHDKDAELAKKRAEAVKWYLVDQGIAADQIDSATGDAAKTPISITAR